MNNETHEILVAKRHASGAEEWYCPTCGRHYIVQWSPEYQCIVLDPGEEKSIHNMSRGAMVVIRPEQPVRAETLAPWLEWLVGMDLEKSLGEEEPLD
jgi:hypothetical protein